jgi:hypothetical protein
MKRRGSPLGSILDRRVTSTDFCRKLFKLLPLRVVDIGLAAVEQPVDAWLCDAALFRNSTLRPSGGYECFDMLNDHG